MRQETKEESVSVRCVECGVSSRRWDYRVNQVHEGTVQFDAAGNECKHDLEMVGEEGDEITCPNCGEELNEAH